MATAIELSSTAANETPSGLEVNSRVEPVRIEWNDVRCSVISKGTGEAQKVDILQGVSGVVNPGQIVAIMGSSGAGKSTLFNILTQRIRQEEYPEYTIQGDILINGQPLTPELFRTYGAYVTQRDVLMHTMTPRESMEFCAALKLPESVTSLERSARVEEIIRELRIQACADSRIGDQRVPGISGGEKKRTAIGIELIGNPSLMFLDEPSSGLDSFTTLKLVTLLRRLSRAGRTIIVTIHQPSEEVFSLFDKLILLSDGKIMYNGPVSNAASYFSNMGYPCPDIRSPADHLLRIVEHCSAPQKSLFAHSHMMSNISGPIMDGSTVMLSPLSSKQAYTTIGSWTQFKLLFLRSWRNHIRQPETLLMFWVQLIFMECFLGLLYFQLGSTQSSITDRFGLILNIVMFMYMSGVMVGLTSIPIERPMFLREKANGMYSAHVYFLSRTETSMIYLISLLDCVNETIWLSFYGVAFASLIFYMAGLTGGFFPFLLVCVALELAGNATGMLIGCAVSRLEVSMALMPFTILPFSMAVGIFIIGDDIPVYMQWMKWASGYRFAYEILCILTFQSLTLFCEADELITADDGTTYCEFTTGLEVLSAYGMGAPNLLMIDFILLGILYFAAMGLSWVFIVNRKDRA